MALIRKNVLKQAPIVRRWLNRSVRTKPMIHDQTSFIRYPIKLCTRDKTFHPWPNHTPMNKYDQSVPQWRNIQPVTTMINPFTSDQTIHRGPNRSHPTKPYTCGQTHASMTNLFTCDQNVHPWPKRSPVTKNRSSVTELFNRVQTIHL